MTNNLAPKFLEHQLTANTKLLQKAAILRYVTDTDSWQVLLLQRAADAASRPNCWDLPGGNSNWPCYLREDSADLHYYDLVREVEEETGLIFTAEELNFQDLVYFSTYFAFEKEVYTMITGWQLDLTAASNDQDESVVISAEHQSSAWVNFTDLSQYDFGAARGEFIVEIIKQAFARKNL